MSDENQALPDKKIPFAVMIIGTFEISVALLGLIILILAGALDANGLAFLILLAIYGAMGAGLWAIQEWARAANVLLHILAIPYVVYTSIFLEGPPGWKPLSQVLISVIIVTALTRPKILHKFRTAAPKQKP